MKGSSSDVLNRNKKEALSIGNASFRRCRYLCKNYLEHVLTLKANERELSDAYKARMDKYLEKKAQGEIKYQSQEDVERSLGVKL